MPPRLPASSARIRRAATGGSRLPLSYLGMASRGRRAFCVNTLRRGAPRPHWFHNLSTPFSPLQTHTFAAACWRARISPLPPRHPTGAAFRRRLYRRGVPPAVGRHARRCHAWQQRDLAAAAWPLFNVGDVALCALGAAEGGVATYMYADRWVSGRR